MGPAELGEQDAIDNLDLMVQVAEKYYLEQLTQAQIAELCNISRSTISRLLSRAREEGIVRIQIIRPQSRHAGLEQQLCLRYKLEDAVVVSAQPSPTQPDEIRHLVGRVAAPFVDSLLKPQSVVGVGRGRTLAEMTYALSRFASPRNMTLVQLLGDIDIHPSHSRGTEITRILCEGYQSAGFFLNAPALISDRQLAQLLLNSAGIQQVSRLYNLLNLALVGIGTLHNSPLVLAGLLEEPEIQRLAAAGAVGDICGHFYTLDGDPVDDAYPGASIGISWEQLRLCPQLLVVASGLEKAAPILGLLRTQMVNVLVTDEQTASRVVRDDRDSSGWALPSTTQM